MPPKVLAPVVRISYPPVRKPMEKSRSVTLTGRGDRKAPPLGKLEPIKPNTVGPGKAKRQTGDRNFVRMSEDLKRLHVFSCGKAK